MYKTIVIDCQNIAADISCAGCIAYRNCEISKQALHSGSVEAQKTIES